MTDKQPDAIATENPETGSSGHSNTETFSPVTVKETDGVVFLGFVSIFLLIELRSALNYSRQLEAKLRNESTAD